MKTEDPRLLASEQLLLYYILDLMRPVAGMVDGMVAGMVGGGGWWWLALWLAWWLVSSVGHFSLDSFRLFVISQSDRIVEAYFKDDFGCLEM